MSNRVNKALESWESLNEVLMDMTEDELKAALKREQGSETPRKEHLKRLHRRLGRMRSQREREELLDGTE